MKIAHLFAGGNIGGIECLCREYTKYSCHEHVIFVLWGDGPVLNEIKKNNVKVYNLGLTSKNILSGVKKVERLCKDKEIDILIAEHEAILSHIILYGLKIKRSKTRTIIYAHCHASFMCREEEKKGLFIRKWIIKKSMNRADGIIAISEAVKNSLEKYFECSYSKITVIHNGIDLGSITYSLENKDNHKILYVGRLIKDKGVQTIIKAVGKLGEHYHLDIVGDGDYRSELEKISKKYNANVTFHGFQSDTNPFLKSTGIFVHVPNCEEGFGLTVVEAMAAGNICIIGKRGALPEIVDDGVDGVLINSDNSDELSSKIRVIAENTSNDKICRMRQKARVKAEQFSMEKYVDKVDSLYANINLYKN